MRGANPRPGRLKQILVKERLQWAIKASKRDIVNVGIESMTPAEKAAALRNTFRASIEAAKVGDDQVKNRKSVLASDTVFKSRAEIGRRERSKSKDGEPNKILPARRPQSSVNVVGETSLYRSRATHSDNSLTKQNSQRLSIKRKKKAIPPRSKSDGRKIDKAAVEKRMPPRCKSNETGCPFPRSSFRNRKASVGAVLTSFRNHTTSTDSEKQGTRDKKEKSTRQSRRSSLATGRADSLSQRKARSSSRERVPEERIRRGLSRKNSGLVGNEDITKRAGRSLSLERGPEQRLRRGLSRKNSGLIGNEDATKRAGRGTSIERAPEQRLRKSLSRRSSGLVGNEDATKRSSRSTSIERVSGQRLPKKLSNRRKSHLVDSVSQREGRSLSRDAKTELNKSLAGLKTESGSGIQQSSSNDEESVVTWKRAHKKKDDKLRAVSDHIPRIKGFSRTASGLGTDGLKACSSHGKLLVDSAGLQSHRERRRNSAFGASCGDLLDSNAIRQSLGMANADKNKNTGKMLVDFPVKAPVTLTADFSAAVDNKTRAMTKNKKASKRSLVKQISKSLVGGEGSFHESFTKIQSEEAECENINTGSIHLSSIHRNNSRGTLQKEGSSRGSLSSFLSNTPSSRNLTGWDSESDDEFAN